MLHLRTAIAAAHRQDRSTTTKLLAAADRAAARLGRDADYWLRPAAEVRMEGIPLGPVLLSIHDLAAIFMIASLAVAVLTNTWPFFVFRDLWPSGRFFYGVIFLLMSIGIAVPLLVARIFAPDHKVIFIEWWEIALFAIFWGLETRRVARIRDEKLEEPDPDRGPLREPYRTTVGEQSIKAEQAREPARQN